MSLVCGIVEHHQYLRTSNVRVGLRVNIPTENHVAIFDVLLIFAF